MKKAIYLVCILGFMITLHTACMKREEESGQKVKIADDFKVIENENRPQAPPVLLRFREDLSIYQDAWLPYKLLVDDEYMYVFSGREYLMIQFNSEGIEVSRKEFHKGQGPGEFDNPDFYFSTDRLLYIADFSLRRLTTLNRDYKIYNISKLDFNGMIFRLDSQNNMYFLVLKFLPGTTSRHRMVLTKYSPSLKILYEIDEYIWGGLTYNKIKNMYVDEVFLPQVRYKIDSNDNIYYAMSDKYEINVVSPEGELIKKITKKGTPRKVTQEDFDRARPNAGNPRIRREYKIPEHMPSIADLFVLDNGYLLVVTFENRHEEPALAGDVFDERGIYRARVQVPKYYRWDFLMAPLKNKAIYRNNHLYTIEADENEENFYVKRYKMIWEKLD